MSDYLFVIPARGGSKGILRKNLKPLAGKPLFWHISETALHVKNIFQKSRIDVLVSSEDDEIIESANQLHTDLAPFKRPVDLADDSSESIFTVLHALNWMEEKYSKRYSHIALLQPTSPLIAASDILKLLDKTSEQGIFNSWTTITQSSVHPFKMKRRSQSGEIFNYIDQGFEDMRPRQSLPPVYKRSGAIYITKREYGVANKSIINSPCFGLEVPSERGVDIDSTMDFEQAKIILKEIDNVQS